MKKFNPHKPDALKEYASLQFDICDLIAEKPELFDAVLTGALNGLKQYEIEKVRKEYEKNYIDK